jgi:hypothetical protein
MHLSSKAARESLKRQSRSKNRSFKKQLSIEIFGPNSNIPKAPQTTKHSQLKNRRQLMDLDDNGMIFNTMQDSGPDLDLQYLKNRNITQTSYGSKEKKSRDRSHRGRSSHKSKPLGILNQNSHNRGDSRKHISQMNRSKTNYSRDFEYSGSHNRSKDRRTREVDYDLNLNYKEPHYNHKVSGSRSGKRNNRDQMKTKENYYNALESMLSQAQN